MFEKDMGQWVKTSMRVFSSLTWAILMVEQCSQKSTRKATKNKTKLLINKINSSTTCIIYI